MCLLANTGYVLVICCFCHLHMLNISPPVIIFTSTKFSLNFRDIIYNRGMRILKWIKHLEKSLAHSTWSINISYCQDCDRHFINIICGKLLAFHMFFLSHSSPSKNMSCGPLRVNAVQVPVYGDHRLGPWDQLHTGFRHPGVLSHWGGRGRHKEYSLWLGHRSSPRGNPVSGNMGSHLIEEFASWWTLPA